jgi:hypothetical protein
MERFMFAQVVRHGLLVLTRFRDNASLVIIVRERLLCIERPSYTILA